MATSEDNAKLAHRFDNGIHVCSLFWNGSPRALARGLRRKSEGAARIRVPRDRALDAFRHPFAYLAATEAVQLDAILAA